MAGGVGGHAAAVWSDCADWPDISDVAPMTQNSMLYQVWEVLVTGRERERR